MKAGWLDDGRGNLHSGNNVIVLFGLLMALGEGDSGNV